MNLTQLSIWSLFKESSELPHEPVVGALPSPSSAKRSSSNAAATCSSSTITELRSPPIRCSPGAIRSQSRPSTTQSLTPSVCGFRPKLSEKPSDLPNVGEARTCAIGIDFEFASLRLGMKSEIAKLGEYHSRRRMRRTFVVQLRESLGRAVTHRARFVVSRAVLLVVPSANSSASQRVDPTYEPRGLPDALAGTRCPHQQFSDRTLVALTPDRVSRPVKAGQTERCELAPNRAVSNAARTAKGGHGILANKDEAKHEHQDTGTHAGRKGRD